MKVKPLKIKIKEPTPSAADRLYAKHQAIRKAKGLPDPSEYKKKLDSMKTEEAELDEGLRQTLRKVVPGYAKKQINQKMDRAKFGKTDSDKDANYYRYKKVADKLKNEDVELQEGRPSQRHPLEGHDYHRKTDAELVHIAKDAHAAAEAMKSHNTTAENKYRDQANDSATVRYYRKKHGMQDWYKKKYGHVKEEAELDEQHAEKGRFKPTMPHNVSNVSTAKTRASSDSANVKLKEAKDPREYDYEGDMAQSQLRSLVFNAEDLIEMMDENTNLPEWVQSKITLAEDYISTAANYMRGELTENVHTAIKKIRQGKPVKEDAEYLEEKNAPTNPALWSRAKALARSKFDVYPSAYANGWAAKWYKSKGGGWKTVSEDIDDPSAAARTLSRKAQIVKNVAKNKKDDNDEASDKFQKDPELASGIEKAP